MGELLYTQDKSITHTHTYTDDIKNITDTSNSSVRIKKIITNDKLIHTNTYSKQK